MKKHTQITEVTLFVERADMTSRYHATVERDGRVELDVKIVGMELSLVAYNDPEVRVNVTTDDEPVTITIFLNDDVEGLDEQEFADDMLVYRVPSDVERYYEAQI